MSFTIAECPPEIIPHSLPETLTIYRAVANIHPDDPLVKPPADDQDRRLTVGEVVNDCVDWTVRPVELTQYAFRGREVGVIVDSLAKVARGRRGWDQANAAMILEDMGLKRQARVARVISSLRTPGLGHRIIGGVCQNYPKLKPSAEV